MGLSFSEHNQSWADLGNLSTATCITRPWTCERGSTISMMIKTDVSCLALDGLLSTYGDSSEQGLLIMCRQNPNGVGYGSRFRNTYLKQFPKNGYLRISISPVLDCKEAPFRGTYLLNST